MTNEATIRRAGPDDVQGCAKVINDWIDGTAWMPRVHSQDTIEGFIHEALPGREIWVTGNPIEAYISYNPETRQIVALYCSRTGAGIGRALIDKVKEGREFLWLTANEPNLKAQRFYAREGFHEVGRQDPEPPETVREVKMEWRR